MSFFEDEDERAAGEEIEAFEEGSSDPDGRRTRRSRRSGRGGSGGGGAAVLQQPAVRILIALGILAVVILIIVTTVRGCQRDRLVSSYKKYVASANTIAQQSFQQGRTLRTLLQNDARQNPAQIEKQLQTLAAQADKLVTNADDLNPPSKMKEAQQSFLLALRLRQRGVAKLPDAVDAAVKSKDDNTAAALLAQPLRLVAASDVLYSNSFTDLANAAMKRDRIKGLTLAQSEFLPGGTGDFASQVGAKGLIDSLKRTRPTSGTTSTTGGNAHGLGLVKVVAVIGGKRTQLLGGGQTTTLQASGDVKWEVTVENGGDFVEFGIPVSTTYVTPDNPNGETQRATIAQIDPSQDKTVTLPGPATPYVSGKSTLRVNVEPLPEEKSTANNSAQYTISFTLS
ncbi:MAG TPA: hypothetical protein VKD47_02915 [Miltoncostaeaceae bacterium]|nr:hypothetical protein [Miltoncostaeaceae bacterium]